MSAGERLDRAVGAILGLACGDALGAPYEFGPGPGAADADFHAPRGWGDPGTWTDDTAMTIAVLLGACETPDLEAPGGLDAIVREFLRWGREDGRGGGQLTMRVMLDANRSATRSGRPMPGVAEFREAAAAAHRRNPDAAGNGALMRTAAVAVVCLEDRQLLAQRARSIAELTHMHPLAGDSCVLWSEAIRVAIVDQRIDVYAGLDLITSGRRPQWRTWLDEAVERPPTSFTPNGWTVAALQAAASAVAHTPEGPEQYERGIHEAIRIGNDTDTVAAIAGSLLGARWGSAVIPSAWQQIVHGWPAMRRDDLLHLVHDVVG